MRLNRHNNSAAPSSPRSSAFCLDQKSLLKKTKKKQQLDIEVILTVKNSIRRLYTIWQTTQWHLCWRHETIITD